MNLTGNEWVSLCAEEANKPIWTISQLTLDALLNVHILGDIKKGLKYNGKAEKFEISYLTINDMIISKGTRITPKFRVSLRKYPENDKVKKDFECIFSYLDINDFYNGVIDLYFDYAEIFNTNIENIKLDLIEMEIMPPVAFTNKGFINSEKLTQYDLDGQISILANLLKTQKWEITNNKIIFTELINENLVQKLLKLFETEFIINHEEQKNMAIDYCEALGTYKAREEIKNNIQKEKSRLSVLQDKVNNSQEFYSLNLRKYIPKFDKEENYNGN